MNGMLEGNVVKKLVDDDLSMCAEVIRKSFITVADDFELTPDNAPTNPAFMTLEKLKGEVMDGVNFFGLYKSNLLIGCVGIKKSRRAGIYYLERLAVVPGERHHGYGMKLLDFAFKEVSNNGGKEVSIGIINENKVLKKWYMNYGFHEIEIKSYDHLPFTVCIMVKGV